MKVGPQPLVDRRELMVSENRRLVAHALSNAQERRRVPDLSLDEKGDQCTRATSDLGTVEDKTTELQVEGTASPVRVDRSGQF